MDKEVALQPRSGLPLQIDGTALEAIIATFYKEKAIEVLYSIRKSESLDVKIEELYWLHHTAAR